MAPQLQQLASQGFPGKSVTCEIFWLPVLLDKPGKVSTFIDGGAETQLGSSHGGHYLDWHQVCK